MELLSVSCAVPTYWLTLRVRGEGGLSTSIGEGRRREPEAGVVLPLLAA